MCLFGVGVGWVLGDVGVVDYVFGVVVYGVEGVVGDFWCGFYCVGDCCVVG